MKIMLKFSFGLMDPKPSTVTPARCPLCAALDSLLENLGDVIMSKCVSAFL